MNQLTQLQIQAMGHLQQLLDKNHIKHGIWGGWIPDIYQGQILRDHGDLDYLFIANQNSNTDLKSLLENDGWKVEIDPHQALVGHQDSLECNFIAVEQKQDKIIWDPPDREGMIIFPADWIQETEFQGIKTNIIDIRFTYVMRYRSHQADQQKASRTKSMRKKDQQDLVVLEKTIQELAKKDHQYLPENFLPQVQIPDSIFGL